MSMTRPEPRKHQRRRSYLASLAPVVALSFYISDTAAAPITRSFEEAIGVFNAIRRALI